MANEYEYMTDSQVPHTEFVNFGTWCPDCKNNAKKLDKNAEMKYCNTHSPDTKGDADRLTDSAWYPSISEEGNRTLCNFLHRGELTQDG